MKIAPAHASIMVAKRAITPACITLNNVSVEVVSFLCGEHGGQCERPILRWCAIVCIYARAPHAYHNTWTDPQFNLTYTLMTHTYTNGRHTLNPLVTFIHPSRFRTQRRHTRTLTHSRTQFYTHGFAPCQQPPVHGSVSLLGGGTETNGDHRQRRSVIEYW